jgi:hypothetical protein
VGCPHRQKLEVITSPPFLKRHQLYIDFDCNVNSDIKGSQLVISSLPGQPCISLNDIASLEEVLYKEFYALDLETIVPYLWVMLTQSSSYVSPLHQQGIKGRNILVTEDPRLHLVWIHNRIFIKPIPKYLLSYFFWETYLLRKPPILGAR